MVLNSQDELNTVVDQFRNSNREHCTQPKIGGSTDVATVTTFIYPDGYITDDSG